MAYFASAGTRLPSQTASHYTHPDVTYGRRAGCSFHEEAKVAKAFGPLSLLVPSRRLVSMGWGACLSTGGGAGPDDASDQGCSAESHAEHPGSPQSKPSRARNRTVPPPGSRRRVAV